MFSNCMASADSLDEARAFWADGVRTFRVVALAAENVDRVATMSADEAALWDGLHGAWSVDRINHSEACSDHGKHTNWVESYFARLRRMVDGQHHHVSPQYLHQYAYKAS